MTSGGKKNKHPQKRPPHQPVSRPRLNLHDIFRAHADMILIALAALHILFFLVFFMNLAVILTPTRPEPFGTTQNATVAPPAPNAALPGPALAGIYALFTLLLWIGIVAMQLHKRRRERRFIGLLLTPGTIMAVWLIARLIWIRNTE